LEDQHILVHEQAGRLHEFTVAAPIPQVGFSAAIRKIRRRSSGDVDGRPARHDRVLRR
jgi:hypothetical protein